MHHSAVARDCELGRETCPRDREPGIFEPWSDALGELEEPTGVTSPDRLGFTCRCETIRSELAQRLQEPIPANVDLVLDKRLVYKVQHALDDIDVAVTGDGFNGIELEGRRKHRQAPEHHLLGLGQQIM
jgi:hypothetical protein